MLGNLKNPPEPFGDVIRTHFRLKARLITKQLDDWLVQDDGRPTHGEGAPLGAKVLPAASGSSSTLQADVAELKALLLKLQDDSSISGWSGAAAGRSS